MTDGRMDGQVAISNSLLKRFQHGVRELSNTVYYIFLYGRPACDIINKITFSDATFVQSYNR